MIIAAEVKRDEQGYWTHPALVRSGCETSAELGEPAEFGKNRTLRFSGHP